jgi:lysophospholipase L1-like esterase
MRNTVLKIVCLVISLTFAFGVAELAVRFFEPQEVAPIRFWFDPQLGDIPVPNQKGRKIKPGVFDHTFSHNSLGFRGRNESRFEKHTDHRILFLGDSFTYGFGVNDDQTFAYLTEKQWLDKHLSVEVINAGVSGKGTDFDLKLFQVLGYKFKPDLTVLCFTANDFIDNERGDYFSVSPDGEISPKTLNNSRGAFKTILWHLPGYNWLVSWSQAANLLKIAGIKWFFNNTNPTVLKEGGLIITYPVYEQGYANDENKRLTNIYVKHIKKTVNKVGSSLMIVYVPVSAEVEAYRNNRQISHDETALTEIAKNHGEMTFSLTPALAASAEPLDKLYFVGDGHWTALGHAVVAQCLSDQIARRFKSP